MVLLDMRTFIHSSRPVQVRQDDYAVSAEFYDVLQAEQDAVRVRRLYGRAVESSRLGVLDVGAGTGRVTLMSLLASQVDVHAIEPAHAMRTPLMTRLASLSAELRARVTVHPTTLGEARLREVADLAICHNMIACLSPSARHVLWPALAEALVPGGSLLLQLPPSGLFPGEVTERRFPEQQVGRHEYGGRMVLSAEGERIRTRFDYWVRESGLLLREHTETFWMWPSSRTAMIKDLEDHGFVPQPAWEDPTVLAMTLGPHPK
ncbi:bifunctional 2-polyprenyl-6-hydroxyphenol methylase/3-demethylubiquinol 3-O-methyltransferase UbiG [Streptomyces sp. V4I2]|uniref:class I SAM-dependent methyltransferase n=1 Tax=Streptomyces sp. V4I2 TaxID=3042280 RepID=UPI002788B74B|nr:class I SAM-dependent methyltransferase [Streptomyces sp. V4I2]MDQ1051372.1 SAM-dependent methyltransferase [Streptomyces sp. V4I2]